ncbi:hypothetical protein PRIO_2697 [Paenibacillus riograndensis SBR5]|uniref:Uncharacterized protein n=1 Tax=Paenibacillus riograndensis SBR5 TaxID=1073571 RepID=A0A0E4CWB8_9BACL|nr:hypothetical protein PRIO_2697 [Paenibacillus riograndensis SBR5]
MVSKMKTTVFKFNGYRMKDPRRHSAVSYLHILFTKDTISFCRK